MFSPTAQVWQRQVEEGVLSGIGDAALLGAPLMGFFASRQCPGSAIRAAMGWAVTQARARLSAEWRAAVIAGHLVVLSAIPDEAAVAPRPTVAGARARNEVVARLAVRIVIAHARPGGQLAGQAADWHAAGRPLQWL